MSVTPEARAAMQRRSRSLRDAAKGLEEIGRAITRDGVLCERLDKIVGGKAIEALAVGANELTAEAAWVERKLGRGEGS